MIALDILADSPSEQKRVTKKSNPWRRVSQAELDRAQKLFPDLQNAHQNLLITLSRGEAVSADTWALLHSQAAGLAIAGLGAVTE